MAVNPIAEFAAQRKKSTLTPTQSTNPIADFAAQRKSPTIQVSSNPIADFVKNKTTPVVKPGSDLFFNATNNLNPSITKSKVKPTLWQTVSKQLMKPVGSVAAETEALAKFIGSGHAYIPGAEAVKVLAGQRETSFVKLWSDNAVNLGVSPKTAGWIGLAFDIALDPLNFISGGLTTSGKLAAKSTSLTTAGKTIEEGSKLATKIDKAGLTPEQLVLAGTKAEQAAQGQRALIKIFGQPIIKGEKFYQSTQAAKQAAGATKVGEGFKKLFSTKTGWKELDNAIENFNNLSEYRKTQVIETAGNIQKQVMKMEPADVKLITEAVENPLIRDGITNPQVLAVANDLESLFKSIKTTEKEVGVLKTELENYFPHIKAQQTLGQRIGYFFDPKKYSTALKAAESRTIRGTVGEINARFGKEFFQTNPALAYAQRGLASAKAVTAKEFLTEVGTKFFVNAEKAPIGFAESTNPLFKGMKAPKEVVEGVDRYIQGIQPEELKLIVRSFDAVQNWWKGQALISSSYHTRNMVGNFWNNFLAGVKNPIVYSKARLVQSGKSSDTVIMVTDAGEKLTAGQVKKLAQRNNIFGKGQYGGDIEQKLANEVDTLRQKITTLKNYNPFSSNNVALQGNRAVGQAIEDNARLAHFIDRLQKGFSAEDAARSVKKYLFDYSDLTWSEKNILKRIMPFYTWTRKNIPLQLENLIVQPAKFAAIPKVIEAIENGVPGPKSEKYFSDYMRNSIPVRIRKNKKGDYEYFFLGNWLPSTSAIDFLSQPLENIINMVTPLAKTPVELWSNQSFFFRNTLGEPSKIEYYYKQPTEFVGIPMRKKVATVLRNIRVLNDIDKLIKKADPDDPRNQLMVRFLNVLFGKAITYDESQAKKFYRKDTENRVNELKKSIKAANKAGNKEQAKELKEEKKKFKKERGN